MATSISGSTGVTYPAGGADNVAGAGVGTTDTQTLTNKTLTSPTVNSPTIGGTPVMGASVITSGTAVASTSGTSIDFTGIPSWVKRITVMFNGVSVSGTSNIQVQLGNGSFVTSGYLCGNTTLNSGGSNLLFPTSGITVLQVNAAADTCVGALTLSLISSNTWTAAGNAIRTNTQATIQMAGSIALAGTLDRVRITTVNGTDTFDAGSINILYE